MVREEVTYTQGINLNLMIQAVHSFIAEDKTAILICGFVMMSISTLQGLHGKVKGQAYKLENRHTQPEL